ncbi:hypothetical protein VPHD51_0138 [Vibrio phage D51]
MKLWLKFWDFLCTCFLSPSSKVAIKEQREKVRSAKLNMKNRFSYSASLAKKAKDARKSKDANQ